MNLEEQRIDGATVYSGVIVDVRLDRARLADGRVSRREVVEHADGVVVLPVDENGMCRMVRQFRYPFGRVMLEAPAGKVEKGEEHRTAAIRELSEETGLEAGRLIYMGGYCSSPGYSTETLHIYLALDLKKGEAHADDGEFLEVEELSLQELENEVMDGRVEDAKTALAVMLAKRFSD